MIAEYLNQTISYAYDTLNRLTSKTYSDSTSVTYTYDDASRLTQVQDPTGTYSFVFDNMGRLKQTTSAYSFVSGNPFTVVYGYDKASNRTSMTDPSNGQTTYSYDTLNRLSNILDFNNNNFGFGYDAVDRRTQLTRPNGINTNYGYDSVSNLLSALHQQGINTLDGATYTYDFAGNRTSKTNRLNGAVSNFSYDNAYQLAGVTGPNPESYTYDPVGNRLTSQSVSNYAYNNSNQLTTAGSATYSYDDNGNTRTKTDGTGTTTYNWDFENRLTSVQLPNSTTVTFKYDPFGRRIQKNSTSVTNYVYDGARTIEEVDGSQNLLAKYSQGAGIDEPLSELRSGAISYYDHDGLGSVTSLSSAGGSLANTYGYDSFGNLTSSSGTLTNPYQYTGRDYDPETGLRYYRARYYDPTTGRFLSEDPVGFAGGINRYSYVGNDPANFVDPFGFQYSTTAPPTTVPPPAPPTTLAPPTTVAPPAPAPTPTPTAALPKGTGFAAGTALVIAEAILVYQMTKTVQAFNAEEAAYAQEMRLFNLANKAWLAKKRKQCEKSSGKMARCEAVRYDSRLHGCIYVCDDGMMWFEDGPCQDSTFIYKPWGEGFPKYPPIPSSPPSK